MSTLQLAFMCLACSVMQKLVVFVALLFTLVYIYICVYYLHLFMYYLPLYVFILAQGKLLCFNSSVSIAKLQFSLKIPKTVSSIHFSANIPFNLTELHYSYDNETWFSLPRKQLILNSVDINLYATYFSLSLKSRGNVTQSCTNLTLSVCSNDLVPIFSLNTSAELLQNVKNISTIVTGQHGSVVSCFIGNESVMLETIYSDINTSSNGIIQTQTLQVAKSNIYMHLCNVCTKSICEFNITCSVKYPGSVKSTSKSVVIYTNIYSSQLQATRTTSSTSSILLSGTILKNECVPVKAIVTVNQKNVLYSLSGNMFQFNVTGLEQCSRYSLTIYSYNIHNVSSFLPLKSNVTTEPFLSPPMFSLQIVESKATASIYNLTVNDTLLTSCSDISIDMTYTLTCVPVNYLARWCPPSLVIKANKTSLISFIAGVQYQIALSWNSSMSRATSVSRLVKTPYGIPQGPPTRLHSVRVNESTVDIKWDLPLKELRFGSISMYHVYVGTKKFLVTTGLNFLLQDLKICQDVNVYVAACQIVDSQERCGANASHFSGDSSYGSFQVSLILGPDDAHTINVSWVYSLPCIPKFTTINVRYKINASTGMIYFFPFLNII